MVSLSGKERFQVFGNLEMKSRNFVFRSGTFYA